MNTALEAPFNEITCCYLAISTTVPDWVAVNFTKALSEEMAWVMNNKEEAARLVVDRKLLLGEYDMVLEELNWFTFYPRDPMIDLPMQTEILYEHGYIESTPIELAQKAVWRPAGLDISELQEAYPWRHMVK